MDTGYTGSIEWFIKSIFGHVANDIRDKASLASTNQGYSVFSSHRITRLKQSIPPLPNWHCNSVLPTLLPPLVKIRLRAAINILIIDPTL
jgi:hypothetical protein